MYFYLQTEVPKSFSTEAKRASLNFLQLVSKFPEIPAYILLDEETAPTLLNVDFSSITRAVLYLPYGSSYISLSEKTESLLCNLRHISYLNIPMCYPLLLKYVAKYCSTLETLIIGRGYSSLNDDRALVYLCGFDPDEVDEHSEILQNIESSQTVCKKLKCFQHEMFMFEDILNIVLLEVFPELETLGHRSIASEADFSEPLLEYIEEQQLDEENSAKCYKLVSM